MQARSVDPRPGGRSEGGGGEGRILFHVGWPKTGTSSLQASLRHHPNLAGHPWDRGEAGRRARSVLTSLCYSPRPDPGELRDLVRASHQDPGRVLLLSDERIVGSPLSHEILGHVGTDVAAQRIAALPGRASVLFTLRDPRDLLRAQYRYNVRHGAHEPYAAFLRRIAEQVSAGQGPYAFGRVVREYAALFGDEDIAIASFEDLLASPPSFWKGIADRLRTPELAGFGDLALASVNRTVLGPPWLERSLNRWVLDSYHRPRAVRRRLGVDRETWASAYRRLGPDRGDRHVEVARSDEEATVALLAIEVRRVHRWSTQDGAHGATAAAPDPTIERTGWTRPTDG